MDNTEIL